MKFNVNSISIQLQFIEFQCHFNQLTAKHHGSCKASWTLHTGITLFQLSSPFAGKMEKQLRSLAAFLGECSRIVSQVLDSSDSSSNGNVTQVLPANSRRTASTVSSAVEWAWSMLQRSRHRRLYSRFVEESESQMVLIARFFCFLNFLGYYQDLEKRRMLRVRAFQPLLRKKKGGFC